MTDRMQFQTLQTRKQAYIQWMQRQATQERIRRNTRLSYRCKLAAILAADNRKGEHYV